MAVFSTTSVGNLGVTIPKQRLDKMKDKIKGGSVIAALSSAEPMLFGQGESFTFDIGEAELVSEGANKSSSVMTAKSFTTKPHKLQKTIRWTDEILWADADHQMTVLEQCLDQMTPALARALDFVGIHGVNPATGAHDSAIVSYIDQSTNLVASGASKPHTYTDTAIADILAKGYVPNGIALDTTFAAKIVTTRGTNSEQKLYPEYEITTAGTSTFQSLTAALSTTVGAKGVIPGGSDIQAIVGDWDLCRWGIQRQMGLELIQFGDPDGNGDLKRNNQVAFRVEIVYGWGVADIDAFALITGETSA